MPLLPLPVESATEARARIQPQAYREIIIELIQEGLIKRFEISFELFWKTLKDYLETEQSISIASPKKAIHTCHNAGFLNDKEAELLLEMVDNRNVSTHDYGRDTATAFSTRIPSYHKLMSDVLKKIKKESI